MTRRFALIFSLTCIALLAPVAAIAQSEADLSVSKSSPFTAGAGSDVPFDVTILNSGPDDAVSVSLTDPLPAGMTFVSLTQNNGPAFDCSSHPSAGTNGTITCTIATLPAGSSANFTFTANIPPDAAPGTTFTNIATASTASADPNDENNSGAAAVTVPEQQADLSVNKLGPASGLPDSDVSYTISVTNAGPDTATAVSLTDTLPGTMTFVSIMQNSGPAFDCSSQPAAGSGGTVTCTIAGLAAGASASFTLTGHIPNGTASGTAYANNATITSSTADPNPDNNSSGAFFIVASSDLAVSKSGPATAIAGNMLAWTITATNNGTDTAPDATLNDVLPAGTTFVSVIQNSGPTANCTGPAAGTTGSVTCTIGNFAPAASAQFTITVMIDPTFAGTLSNTATISGSNADPNTNNNSSTSSTTVSSSADLTINKSGPATANAGTDITYAVTLTNSGPSAAASVSLTDTIPANTTFVSASQTSGPAFSCSKPAVGGTGNINCTIGSFATGSATFSITVHIAPNASGTVSNTALVSTATSDPNATGNNPTVTTTVTRSADISVVKTAPATATAGTNLAYNITVTNNGPSDATTVTMSDTLPPNTTFVSESQPTGPAFICTNPSVGAPGTISCSIAALTNGTTATFTIVVHVAANASSSISNTASVSSANDPNTGNNSSTATTAIGLSADISVVKTAAATATAGTNLSYNITVTNNGPSDATTVTMSDTLPPNTTFVSESQPTGPAFICTNPSVGAPGTVSCSIATLTNGTTATFTIVVHVAANASSSISNTASVSSANDPNTGNNSSTATTAIGLSADISVVKTAAATATAGTNLTYNITVTNNGPSDATTVTMSDTLPPNTTFVSESQPTGPAFVCTNPSVGAAGIVSCSVAALTAGTTATFTIVVQIAPTTPAGPSSNTANVTSANDSNAGNNSSTATTTIAAAAADLSITKTPAAGPYGTGSLLTYTIVVTNGGPNVANSVVVTDVLPAGTTYQSSTPSGACSGTTTITCNGGTLANGASATFTLTIVLPTTAGTITNTATVSAAPSSPDTNLGNNTATSTITVIPAANIPMVSPLSLLLLCVALAIAGAFVQKQ